MDQVSGSGVSRRIGWLLGLIAAAMIVAGLVSMWAENNNDDAQGAAEEPHAEVEPVEPISFEAALAENTEAAPGPQNIDDVIEVLETGWALTQTGRTDTLVLFRNSGSVTWTDVTVEIHVLGALGQVVDTKRSFIQLLVPGRTFAASRVTNTLRDDVSGLRISATALGSSATTEDGYWITVDPWRVGPTGQPLVEGSVQASYDPPLDRLITLAVLRDANGKFAGSAYDAIDSPSADTTGYSISVWDSEAVTTAEVYIAS